MADEAFADALREVVRGELGGVSVCTFAIIKSVDHSSQTVTIALKNDSNYVDDDIPLLTGVAGDGYGDIPAVTAGDEVLVVFSADDITQMRSRRGATPEADRTDTHNDAVALPLTFYSGEDEVPDHTPGERIIAHPNGTMIRLGPGGEDFRVEHPSGTELTLDSTRESPETEDARESPDSTTGVARLTHASGVSVTIGDDGVAITPGDADGEPAGGYGYGGYDDGEYGGGGHQQGVTSHRRHNDPWRVELAGAPSRPHEGHRHLIPQGDGTMALTTPPVPHREVFEWLLADYADLVNTGPRLDDARAYYQAYFDWLETQTDATLDPVVGEGDVAAEWPYPEPVPDADDRDSFSP